MLVAFLHYSFRFFRSYGALVLSGCLVVGVGCFYCGVASVWFGAVLLGSVALLGLWACVAWLLRSALFVRFPSPSAALGSAAALALRPLAFPPCAWGCGGLSGCAYRWRVVSAAALPAVRRRLPVWVVRPAVVRRRSGLVLFFWVFVAENPEETKAGTETEIAIVFANAKTIAKTLLKRKFEFAI